MVAVGSIAASLRVINEFIAGVTATPEFALDDDMTKRLSGAIAEAQKHFPIPALNPKYVALGVLFATARAAYAQPIKAMIIRKRGGVPVPATRREVVNLRPVPNPPAAPSQGLPPAPDAGDWLNPAS